MEFNEKLRLLRKNAGLTQRQVADAVGVTYRTYQNYEAGASSPSGDVASRLAAALGVSTDTLLSAALASAPEAPDRALRALLAEMQALFAGGALFGSAGIKLLSSKDARKAYAHTTAAALRAKDCMMTKVTAVREGADDIYAEAKAINERRAEAEDAAVVEDASAEDAKAE